ncbi:C-C motif chemokine 20 [Conger conger]|nr:C-C motif chemokine 20 [Conger conger]
MFECRPIFAVLLGVLLSIPSHNAAFGPLKHACCVKYTVKPLPFGSIKGFVEQSSREICRIDAIIFFTIRDKKVCASAEDEWVKRYLLRLSSKLKTLVSNSDLKSTNGSGNIN